MALQPASRKNLIPFKKNNTHGKGRPKRLPELDELLADVLSRETAGRSTLESILLGLVRKAKMGYVRAAELLLNRKYGKLKDTVNVIDTITVEVQEEPCTIQWGNKILELKR